MPKVSSDTAWLSRGATGPGIGRISLPKPLTSFIGRERELALAKRLLGGSYLVTLTGPAGRPCGGPGKARQHGTADPIPTRPVHGAGRSSQGAQPADRPLYVVFGTAAQARLNSRRI